MVQNKHPIIIADDHAIFRSGLRKLIEEDAQFAIVGEASNGEELISLLRVVNCEIVILDLSMPTMNGLETLLKLKEMEVSAKIIVLTIYQDSDHLKYALKNGALGYVLKEDTFEQLRTAIKAVLHDRKFISPKITDSIANNYVETLTKEMPCPQILTKTETSILRLISEGQTSKEIAHTMKSSPRTVETHRANILRKLGVKNTAGLVKYAFDHKLASLH